MESNKTNRRVQYTKMALKHSFIELLGKKDITKITVKELCESADINRTTFYLHFKDPYDLLEQVEQELIDGVDTYLASCNFTHPSQFPIEGLEKLVDYVKENKELFHILLNKNNDMTFQKKILNIIGKQYFFSESNPAFATHPQGDYIFLFFANGALGILKKWLEEDAVLPSRDIAALIIKIAAYGSSSLTG